MRMILIRIAAGPRGASFKYDFHTGFGA